jgi:hypothetical protein
MKTKEKILINLPSYTISYLTDKEFHEHTEGIEPVETKTGYVYNSTEYQFIIIALK